MLHVTLAHAFADFALEVSFTAPAGVTVLFGRSGAGKSTVAKAIGGLLRPDTGRITLADRRLVDTANGLWTPPHRRRIGYVFQEPRLFPHLSVRQNLLFGAPSQSGLMRIADMLDIGALLDRRPAGLSGGEASRVALGRALLSAPDLLVLDEPLSALDAARKAEILPYLERLRDEAGTPMVYVTHDLDEVARLGTTMVLLDAGKVVQVGAVAQVLSEPAHATVLGPRAVGAVLEGRVQDHADGLTQLQVSNGALWVPGDYGQPGARLRVRVMAQDIIIGTHPPQGLSALNVLAAQITDIHVGPGPGAMVGLACGTDRLLARITRRSLAELDLREGQTVYAILKSVAVGPGAIMR